MTKNQKVLLGAIGIGVGLWIWKNSRNKKPSSIPVATPCPEGEVPCAENSTICYNPKANYYVNPCASVQ